MLSKKKITIFVIAILLVAAAVAAVLVYQNKYQKTADPSEIKGLWMTKEVRQGDELLSEGFNGAMLAIDQKGGYRFWDIEIESDQVGKLAERDGQLHFTGADGAEYSLYGQGGELIVSVKSGGMQQTWICERQGDYRDTQMTDQEFEEKYYALQKEGMDIKDPVYRGLYLGTKTKMLQEVDEESAILSAREGVVEKAACAWQAENLAIVVTDKEVETYMDNLISEGKKADNFEEVEAAYQKIGLTFEKSIRMQKELYRSVCILGKLSERHPKDWETFKADLIKQYKETSEYEALQIRLDKAEAKLKKEIHK